MPWHAIFLGPWKQKVGVGQWQTSFMEERTPAPFCSSPTFSTLKPSGMLAWYRIQNIYFYIKILKKIG
jgi:hypothetical protein